MTVVSVEKRVQNVGHNVTWVPKKWLGEQTKLLNSCNQRKNLTFGLVTNINFVVYRLVRDSALVIVLAQILRAYKSDFDLFYIYQLITQR